MFPMADPVLCVLPRTISIQTNLRRYATTRSGLFALTVLFGTAALLAWFVEYGIHRRFPASGTKHEAPPSPQLPQGQTGNDENDSMKASS